jgi:hypothetical protein
MIADAPPRRRRERSSSPTDLGLYSRYLTYRERTASALLSVIPRDGIRPLYRAARAWAVEIGLHESQDPMATLLAYCERLLPLPPFDVWSADYNSHRLAYMEELARPPLTSVQAEPVMVSVRGIQPPSEPTWYATLFVGHDGVDWRGHIAFHNDATEQAHGTADIFIEDQLDSIRERFDAFSDATLIAFLRSTLP